MKPTTFPFFFGDVNEGFLGQGKERRKRRAEQRPQPCGRRLDLAQAHARPSGASPRSGRGPRGPQPAPSLAFSRQAHELTVQAQVVSELWVEAKRDDAPLPDRNRVAVVSPGRSPRPRRSTRPAERG